MEGKESLQTGPRIVSATDLPGLGGGGAILRQLRFGEAIYSYSGAISATAFRRMEWAPGEVVQVDFGQGAWVRGEEGKRKRPRIVLSHSRKAYSEVVWR
jgi:hypothetical protein